MMQKNTIDRIARDGTALSIVMLMLMLGLFFSFGAENVNAQQRIVEVEPDNFPAEIGNLNRAIEDDTQRDENTVYVLQRGGTYWLDAIIEPEGGLLHIEAEEGAGPLPVIKPASDLLGQASELFNPRSNIKLKNLYLQGLSDLGEITKNNIRIRAGNVRVEVDSIYFDWDDQAFYRMDNENITLIIKDSKHRNTGRIGNVGVGRWIDMRSNIQDTIYVENSTFYGGTTNVLRAAGGRVDFVKFNHNTIVDGGTSLDFGGSLEVEFTNNLLIDVGYRGTGVPTDEEGNLLPDSIGVGILQFGSIEDVEGLQDADRTLIFRNNNLGFHSQPFLDLLAQFPDTVAVPRDIFKGFADTLRAEGILIDEDNFEEGVVFTDRPDAPLAWLEAILDDPSATDPPPPFDKNDEAMNDPENAADLAQWRDLSYPTTALSYTSAANGFPVGDLNWFPDKREEFEGVLTSSEDDGQIAEIPDEFEIIGNFPNPFNPTTNINFELASPGNVAMDVFNVVGQKVATVDVGARSAGNHTFTFDASNLSSGVYIVRMTAGNQVATSRITLIK